jgi:hypothetical protein
MSPLILLLVEGPSDKTALPILAGKIVSKSTHVIAQPVGKGDLFNPDKLRVHIKFACKNNPTIRKVLACVDSENVPIEETQNRVAILGKQLEQLYSSVSIKYIVVDHSIEGWLLCDRKAVSRVLGKNAILPKYRNPENEMNPFGILENIFRKNGRSFKKPRTSQYWRTNPIHKIY